MPRYKADHLASSFYGRRSVPRPPVCVIDEIDEKPHRSPLQLAMGLEDARNPCFRLRRATCVNAGLHAIPNLPNVRK